MPFYLWHDFCFYNVYEERRESMQFWKMNGAGNDFLIFNNMKGEIEYEKWPMIAKTLCERHLSVGADGVMVVDRPEQSADYRMTYYNSDGSLGEMCGNGARCICRYGFENHLAGEKQVIETTAGRIVGERIDKRMYKVLLNAPSLIERKKKAVIDGQEYIYSYVELGDPGLPHAAVPMKNLKEMPAEKLFDLGRKLRYYKDFPKGANINFYECMNDGSVYEITYERGVEDFTYACGTGTAAVVIDLYLDGKTEGKSTKVGMRGGELFIDIIGTKTSVDQVYLTGLTNIIVKGEIFDEELDL